MRHAGPAGGRDVDVLIVGAGPAGASTALHLCRRDPRWAGRVVVLERAEHPRPKLCGGAVTYLGERVLGRLGLGFNVPHVRVGEVRVVHHGSTCSFRGDPIARVARRDELDAWLVRECEARGVPVRQREAVVGLEVEPDGVRVTTTRGEYRAQVVVGADGSNSTVRRMLGLLDKDHLCRLLEVLTPVEEAAAPLVRDGVVVFDFGLLGGLTGYYWDFPSLVGGVPTMNRGVFEGRAGPGSPRLPLEPTLRAALAARGHDLGALKLQGHPIRAYHRDATVAVPRVLLAGDAAGTDALLGEGISFALGYGDVAATAIQRAFAERCFDFAGYRAAIEGHRLLRQLPVRTWLARRNRALGSPGTIDALMAIARGLVARSRFRDPRFEPARAHHWLLDG